MLGPAFGRSRCDPLKLLVSDPERPGAVSPETLPHEGSSVGCLAQRRPGEAREREGLIQGGIWGYRRAGGAAGPTDRRGSSPGAGSRGQAHRGHSHRAESRRGKGPLSAHHWLTLVPKWRGVHIILSLFFEQTQQCMVGTDAAWPVRRSSREGAFKDDKGRHWVQGSPM